MMTVLGSVLVVVITALVNGSMVRRPLTIDEGNWFYTAAFSHRGVHQLYSSCDIPLALKPSFFPFYRTGYINITTFAEIFSNLFNKRSPEFLKKFKIGAICVGACSTQILAEVLFKDVSVGVLAGVLFGLIAAVPASGLYMTCGETTQLIAINLSVIFLWLGVESFSVALFFMAGTSMALVILQKAAGWFFAGITGLIVIIMAVWCPHLVSPAMLLSSIAGFVLCLALPALWLVHKAKLHHNGALPLKMYLYLIFCMPIFSGLLALFKRRELSHKADYVSLNRSIHKDKAISSMIHYLGIPSRVLWPFIIIACSGLLYGLIQGELQSIVLLALF